MGEPSIDPSSHHSHESGFQSATSLSSLDRKQQKISSSTITTSSTGSSGSSNEHSSSQEGTQTQKLSNSSSLTTCTFLLSLHLAGKTISDLIKNCEPKAIHRGVTSLQAQNRKMSSSGSLGSLASSACGGSPVTVPRGLSRLDLHKNSASDKGHTTSNSESSKVTTISRRSATAVRHQQSHKGERN